MLPGKKMSKQFYFSFVPGGTDSCSPVEGHSHAVHIFVACRKRIAFMGMSVSAISSFALEILHTSVYLPMGKFSQAEILGKSVRLVIPRCFAMPAALMSAPPQGRDIVCRGTRAKGRPRQETPAWGRSGICRRQQRGIRREVRPARMGALLPEAFHPAKQRAVARPLY